MNVAMKRLLLGSLAGISLAAATAYFLWPDPALAGCRANAGLGNGSEIFGDPGNSGFFNQAANAPAQPGSAAAQADPLHELDDEGEPN